MGSKYLLVQLEDTNDGGIQERLIEPPITIQHEVSGRSNVRSKPNTRKPVTRKGKCTEHYYCDHRVYDGPVVSKICSNGDKYPDNFGDICNERGGAHKSKS